MLTEDEIKEATKKAREGLILLSDSFVASLGNANRANKMKPLAKGLTESKKRELEKVIRGKKK